MSGQLSSTGNSFCERRALTSQAAMFTDSATMTTLKMKASRL